MSGTVGDSSPSSVHSHACAFLRLRACSDHQRLALIFDEIVIVTEQGFSIMRYADVCAVLLELTTLDSDADELSFLQHLIIPDKLYELMMQLLALNFDKTRAPTRVIISRAREALLAAPSDVRDGFHLEASAFAPLGIDAAAELVPSSAWAHLSYGMLADSISRSTSRAALLEYALCAPRGDGNSLNADILERARHTIYDLVAEHLFSTGAHADENATRFARALGSLAMPAPLQSFCADFIGRIDAVNEDVRYMARPTKREEEIVLSRLCSEDFMHAYANLRLAVHDERLKPQMRSHLEQLLRVARQPVVFRLYAFDALDRVVKDHAAWLRLPSVAELMVRERVAALCARITESTSAGTFHVRAGGGLGAGSDIALAQAPVTKGGAWAAALAEAKATPSCTTLVHEVVQLLQAAPLDKQAIFALLLRGRDEAEDDSYAVPKKVPAIPPVAALVQAAWGKVDFALIDRRLQPMTLLLEHVDVYLAAVGVSVAKADALVPEALSSLRLPALLEALRRPGKEWGDRKNGLNFITQIYVPVWRYKHSRAATDSPLDAQVTDPYHDMKHLGESLPYLRQLLFALGLPFHGLGSLYAIFKETHKYALCSSTCTGCGISLFFS